MKASPAETRHFEAIAAGETASEEERFARPQELGPAERIQIGFELGVALPWTRAILAEADAQADGQMELARRRIAMGLDKAAAR